MNYLTKYALKKVTRRGFLKASVTGVLSAGLAPSALAQIAKASARNRTANYDHFIKDYLHKMKNFNVYHTGDIVLSRPDFNLLKSSTKRLDRLRRTVGHGNFHLLSFDDALKTARNYSRVGGFSKAEINFLEKIFYEDASRYGFFGQKPLKTLTDEISRRNVVKIPYSGNYLYKGQPVVTYEHIKQTVGDQVILTSGVRSVMKQFLLFLNKAYNHKGNLSLASRSLAPPGYSYHGVGDFDVGQVGFGAANFTERFITTDVFSQLKDLGYLTLRYPQDNLLGVRYEPWHIKVHAKV